jgi:hypothetical protein
MGNSIQHKPWCVEHEVHDDGSSWYCSRTLYGPRASAGVLVELTWDPERGTRLILFADLDRSLERKEARDIAIAISVGSDQLESGYGVETSDRCPDCAQVWAEHGPNAAAVCTCGTLTKLCSRGARPCRRRTVPPLLPRAGALFAA